MKIYTISGNIELSEFEARNFIGKYPELLKELEPGVDYKAWRAEQSGTYYFIDSLGFVCNTIDESFGEDDYRYLIGNYYKTKTEAEKALAYNLALGRVTHAITEANAGWIADWDNANERKYWIGYNHDDKRLYRNWNLFSQVSNKLPFIELEGMVLKIIKEHKDDLITILNK